MRSYQGRVTEIQLDAWERRSAWIACPPAAIPSAGRYLLGRLSADPLATLAEPLFPGQITAERFQTAGSLPASWEPGMILNLRGPLGQGFSLPENAHRIALIDLAETPARLLPLVSQAVKGQLAAALFTDTTLTGLPAALEIQPLSGLSEALSWADYIAIDLPLGSLAELRHHLGLSAADRLPCPAQALIVTPMPCGGMAECGACAVPAQRGWKLACKDGPVFNLSELSW